MSKNENTNIKNRKQSGVTLVALTVTIVVLIILAGISIAMLTGENGILTRAKQAKEETELAQINEELQLIWLETQSEIAGENLTNEEIAEYFEKKLQENDENASVEYVSSDNIYDIYYKNYKFEIKADENSNTGTSNPDTSKDRNNDSNINVDTDGDGEPDINIDTDGDGKPDIDIDTDGDGVPDTNVTKLAIVKNPVSVNTISKTEDISFRTVVTGASSVNASEEETITYQWYYNTTGTNEKGTLIEGATDSIYTISKDSVTVSISERYYYCVITQEYRNKTNVETTEVAKLTVVSQVEITNQPTSVQVIEGQKDVTFEVVASGEGNITYQWYKNDIDSNVGGTLIEEATGSTYTIEAEDITVDLDGIYYYVTVTQRYGSSAITVTSNTALLEVKGTSISADVTDITMQYGGESQEIHLSGVNAGDFEIITSPDDSIATAYKEGDKVTITPVGAGETIIIIRETNGNKTVEIPITVEKATPEITLSANSGAVDYGEINSFTATATSSPAVNGTWQITSSDTNKVTIETGNSTGATDGVATTITYKGEGATTEDITITITFVPNDTNNYNEQTATYIVTVNKVPATNPTLTAYTGTYDGQPHTIEVTGGSGGTIVYSTDQVTWTEELPTRTENGTTTVYVKVIGDSNHTDTEVISSTITIGETLITYQSGDYKGIYDGNPHTITLNVTIPSTGITIYYSTEEQLNEGNYDTIGTASKPERTDAGETIVYWYIHSENTNYSDVAGNNKITIERATIGEEGGDLVTASPVLGESGNNLIYNGTEQRGVEGTNVTWEGTTNATDAGTYIATATPTSNYAWSNGGTEAREVTWTIEQKQVEVVWGETQLTYNGEVQIPEATVDTGIEKETISLNITSDTEAIDIGTYTAIASISKVTGGQGKAENYILTNTTKQYEIVAKQINIEDPNSNIRASLSQTTVMYNGTEQMPEVLITDGDTQLTKDIDYTVNYANNINVGTATVTITLKGNYSGTVILNFEIEKMPISIPSGATLTYNGKSQIGVGQGNGYTVTGNTGVNVGQYTATATLIDTANTQWTDGTTEQKLINWEIIAKTPSTENPDEESSNITVTLNEDSYIYDGTEKTPTPTVVDTDLSSTLVLNTDYTVSYSNNINVGTATVTITLKGNYSGTITKTFTINKKEIEIPTPVENLIYNGSEQTGITAGDGYIVENGTATNVGTYTATVSLTDTTNTQWTDKTTDEKQIEWSIIAKTVNDNDQNSDITITLSQTNYIYDGTPKEPIPTVKDIAINLTLEQGTDYDVSYSNNIDEGTATVTITLKGNYSGTLTANFTIEAGGMEISSSDYNAQYDGEPHSITVTVTTPSSGTTVYYSDSTELDETNYETDGTRTNPTRTDVGETIIYWYVHSEDTNYNDKSGNNKIIITRQTTGADGEPSVKFETIESVQGNKLIYNGTTQTGVTGTNVTITGTTEAINVGTYTAIATPTSNYAWSDGTTDEREISWSISEKQVEVVWGNTTSFTYNGTEQGPTATIESGVANETINLSTTKEINVGNYISTASIESVTGGQALASNYILTNQTLSFVINKQNITIPTAITGLIYNGFTQTGVEAGEGYTIINNTGLKAGTYTAIATLEDTENTQWNDGTVNTKQIQWVISAKSSTTTNPDDDNANITVTLSQDIYTYDGTEKNPTVEVKDVALDSILTQDTDYTISYSNNTNAGTATVTITLKGNYSGTLTKNFTINKKEIDIPTPVENLVYNGSVQTGVNVGEGYTLTGNTGTDAGNYTATATLKDTANTQWSDKTTADQEINWKIAVKEISATNPDEANIEVTLEEDTYIYDGTEKKPTATVRDTEINKTLTQETDYTVTYSNNTNAGTAQAIITLKGNYSGTLTKNFTIEKKSIDIPTAEQNLVYNGQTQTGVQPGDGYELEDNTAIDVGDYTATATLKDTANTQWSDKTTDSQKINWSITAKPIVEGSTDITVELSDTSYTYDGTAKTPTVTVKDNTTGATLERNTDYTLEYADNINVGTATVKIILQKNYSGTITKEFTIKASGMQIRAEDYTGIYDGQEHTITLEVTSPTGTTIYYSEEELTESNYTEKGETESPTRINAGETTVYWYIVSNNSNYNDESGSNKITINKAEGTATVTITGTNKVGETLEAEVTTRVRWSKKLSMVV